VRDEGLRLRVEGLEHRAYIGHRAWGVQGLGIRDLVLGFRV
jgi:hypothetical protein